MDLVSFFLFMHFFLKWQNFWYGVATDDSGACVSFIFYFLFFCNNQNCNWELLAYQSWKCATYHGFQESECLVLACGPLLEMHGYQGYINWSSLARSSGCRSAILEAGLILVYFTWWWCAWWCGRCTVWLSNWWSSLVALYHYFRLVWLGLIQIWFGKFFMTLSMGTCNVTICGSINKNVIIHIYK